MEIPLPKVYQYHSVFTCPVSREPTTDMNPPMILPCGHVISRESLIRISKGKGANATTAAPPVLTTTETNEMDVDGPVRTIVDVFNGVNLSSKLKCPYCPTECTIGQTMRVVF